MNEWNAMTFDARDNILRVVKREAEQMFAMAELPDMWESPTACTGWTVRDVIGHMVDTTESYFPAFEAARGGDQAEPAYGLPGMAARVNERATSFRGTSQAEMMDRVRADFQKMMDLLEGLTAEDWTGLFVPHFYMGPLPSFFYPAFQLMDYGVHSWDIRQGVGRPHGLAGDVADLLAPFMLVLWQYTAAIPPGAEPFEVGIRVTSGPNAGDYLVNLTPEGWTHEPADAETAPVVFEFDPGSLVLTAFGRANAGTYRGDPRTADQFLNLFFRI
ncbi:MAG TPA: maleylpyruvate isomerase family mycothiol-dependent enzyme [Actinomycetota bacterium]|nr:maleylpyruvate isomerase family mycothiol-dependent enzyme [Actinomycetota bacterium]